MTRLQYFNRHGDAVGFSEDRIYFTTRTSSKHFFIRFHGYGLSLFILDQLRINGVRLVNIKENLKEGSSRFWLSYIDSWYRLSHDWVDEGVDAQKILPLRFMWDESENPPPEVEESRKRAEKMFSPYQGQLT